MLNSQSKFAVYALAAAGAFLLAASANAADSKPRIDVSKPHIQVYPEASQRAGEEGNVIVRVFVSRDGAVQKVNVAKSSGYKALDNAAVESVLNWHYLPATQGNQTVGDWATLQVVYKLPNDGAAPSDN